MKDLSLKIDFENQILALFDVYFWPFNKSHEKINAIFVIGATMVQSEMFLSNSVDMMKNLPLTVTVTLNAPHNSAKIMRSRCRRRNVALKLSFPNAPVFSEINLLSKRGSIDNCV